ncbi:MAG: helix-turn-helix transcriptional regulator [Formivibrio sp.]|nr:helix-turn-helix transcriptional regulator [Formivibrio sp.]
MDIKQTISELLSTGLTQHKLASLANCSQSTIASILNGSRGKRISFDIGQRLTTLHKDRCCAIQEKLAHPDILLPKETA